MKVLIVEDDQALGLFLRKGLAIEGYDTEWVGDGEAGVTCARAGQPQLIILDLTLPGKDGVQVLEEIRTWSTAPAIVVLTGRNSVEERVRCLNLGADDCLLKPFSFHELTARCNAIFRRRDRSKGSATLSCGAIEMDLLSRKVWREGRAIDLTVKEFALLEYLLRHQGVCCSREELLRDLWQARTDAVTNIVDVYVNYLRKKLAAAAPEELYAGSVIETVRGSGYRLAGADPQLARLN